LKLFKRTYSIEELIDGCKKNDRRCQEHLYRLYFDTMIRMCKKYINDEEEAILVLNNGFLKVFQNIEHFAFKGSFEGWIRRIVYHAVVEYFRKHNRYLKFIILDDTKHEKSSEGGALEQMYSDDILSLMQNVPTTSAKVFEMYAIEGYNHREIGEVLGMSENTSKWHLANARKHLKAQMKKMDVKNNIAG